jgi:DNA-3-methyladenine glycosylase
MTDSDRLPQRFYLRDATTVARALLGQRLVSMVGGQRTAGIIVETEAYLGVEDRAAHTFGGRRTARNASMWRGGGLAYVYFVYGMHHCVNVVAGDPDDPVAVLIRALAPSGGLATMRARRTAARRDADLCSGPAKLCEALAIDLDLDGADLVAGNTLFIEQVRRRTMPRSQIASGPRIGVDYAAHWRDAELRFWVRDDPNVSR